MPAKEEKQLAGSLAQRKCLFKVFDALERFIRDYDHDRDSFQLCVRIDSLDKMNETFAECQSVIEKLDAPEALDEHIDERVEFEQRYCKAKGFLLSKRTGDPNQSALNDSIHAPQQHQANFHLRLSKIDLPKFNGDFSRWISFRDTFTSMIHVNGDIPTVAKLQYLLQSLEGSAKKPFESVDIAADSYATTWDALLKRYDNRKYLKKQLFKALYELPAVKQECATRIHGLVDDYQRHVRALAKLGEPVDYWDLPLIYLLSYKLDHATLRAWEEKTSHKDDVKYDELVDFLYQRVRILNSVGPDSYQSASSKVAGFQQKSFKQKVSVNASASSTPSYSCPLSCSDSHSIRICPVFLGKNVSQRRELASQKRLCWNCLSVGHQSKKCNSKYNCRTCHEKHHSLLHDFAPAKILFSRRSTVNVSVAGIGSSTQKISSAITATIESGDRTISMKLQFLVLKQPSSELPTTPIDISAWKIPSVELADPHFNVPGNVDLVIGSETYWELHTGRKISLGEGFPWVVETLFGWAVTGPASRSATCIPRFCYLSTADDRLEAALRKFWDMETIPSAPVRSTEESICEEHYAATTMRNSAGRYIVRLPRTEDSEKVLGESRSIADRHFLSLERRQDRDPAIKDSCHRFMEDYLQLGHMQEVPEPVDDRIEHSYIPHHVVFKESSTTTKVRVVFDASCKTSSGYSLNDTLLVGPVVQQDLYFIYTRFRTQRISIVADVEKMYRCPSDPIATFELQTVTYGTASAPYLATKTLQQIAIDQAEFYPAAVDPVVEDFYVDDLLSGTSDVESAKTLRLQITAMLGSAGFLLKKWASNAPEVLRDVPPEDLAIQPLHDLQDEQIISTLGLLWDPKADNLRFKVEVPLPAAILTKRKVMSYIAKIFDPLGLLGPVITKAKLFMQRLWALKHDGVLCEWDSPLPDQLQHEWKQFHTTLHILATVQVPRFVFLSVGATIQLHFFADASSVAYGACCFVRMESAEGIRVQLLTSKSKVAPLSTHHSIARLELCAAHLATQLFKKVDASLKTTTIAYFWSDSSTVLQWLRAVSTRWKTFVANRVSKIQATTSIDHWRHIAGSENPADDISRGLNPTDIINCSRWWHGPSWLALSLEYWPKTVIDQNSPAASEEGRKAPIVAMTAAQADFCGDLFSRYSRYNKLRRVVAFCGRYIQRLKKRIELRSSGSSLPLLAISSRFIATSIVPLTTSELQHAEYLLCRLAQKETFAEELSDLSNGERVAKSSSLKWLKPFVDEDGTLRVGGRLRNAALSVANKHPIVLSAKHPLSALLASSFHISLLHAGPQLLLATLRQKFWILGGRNLVKSVFHQCHTCFRSKPTLVQQSTADLPVSRVSPTRPFSVCGVDYCGPFYVKSAVRTRGPTKVYVAIFVCFSPKAVHIELVSNLSTPAFLAALRRLVARRGRIVELHSDNATIFKGASHALNRVYRMLKTKAADRNQIFDWCSGNEITWKFIPPRAPHFGGLWEAAVKSAKHHLLKVVGNVNLAYEDLLTLLAQVEMCLNSRPLTPIPEDPTDLDVLTPGHFLVGSNLQAVPESNWKETADNRLDHWDRTQKHLQQIWSRWYPEYLQQLQSRATKGCNPPVTIEVGAIVIIKEDNVPPANWPLGKIVKLHPGKDGIVRVVTLKTANANEVVRAVARIALLPTPRST
ncbi:uncharacterized protein LOC134206294 [Armigeres subalbatus]|uniref:uncharacterized protein LOC134206294 n=1 Tax=Armigeres subalbatus TaxID=124917 RepID=UPI002ED4D4FC